MSILCGNQINKIIDDSIPPLPSAWEFYNKKPIEVQERENATIEHGTGRCKCCTHPAIVQKNEENWARIWKQIQRQKRLAKTKEEQEQGRSDRWDREHEQYEKWRMMWGFF